MAADAPKWKIGDTVYLEVSARIGFLEAYRVSGIFKIRGSWAYTIAIGPKPPAEPTIGDAIDIKRDHTLYFDERELIGLHEALLLAKDALNKKIIKIQQLLDRHFPGGTDQ
jgi:hypothetical protein